MSYNGFGCSKILFFILLNELFVFFFCLLVFFFNKVSSWAVFVADFIRISS